MVRERLINRVALFISVAALASPLCQAQAEPRITSILIGGGKVNLEIDAPAGEMIVQSTTDLQPTGWIQLSRLRADGNLQDFDDPLDPEPDRKFYRAFTVPAADEFHLSGEFATALKAAIAYSDIQNVFGLTFPEGEATIPPGNDLSYSTRNARIYAAVIASISKLAKDVSDFFPPESRPSAATIAAAFASDLADGNLDGNNNGTPVQIGTTGTALPAFTQQDFQDALDVVKAAIPGLYNVFFEGAVAAPAAFSPKAGISFAAAATGSFSPSAPAKWGDFYWDSSDWQ